MVKEELASHRGTSQTGASRWPVAGQRLALVLAQDTETTEKP